MIVIVPSRGRPHNIAELIEAWMETDATAHLWVWVDEDDPVVDEYRAIELPNWASLTVGPRLRLGPTLNLVAQFAIIYTDVVGFMGDDHRPRTVGWDQRLFDAALASAPTPGIAYGNDLVQGENLPTAVFMDAWVVGALGYMVPPGMTHLYLDDFWKLLGQRLGTLTYLPDVVIEHCHPTAGTAPNDQGYAEVNHPSMYAHDKAIFDEYVATRLDADVAKLQALR